MATVTLNRSQLYDQVWKTPIRKLAGRYGLSDVGLAKVCERHHVPRPPAGYWAMRDAGKAPPRPELPQCPDASLDRIMLHDGPVPKPSASPPEPEPEYDQDIAALLQRANALPKVLPAETLRGPHPLVQATREGLEGVEPDKDNMVSPRQTGRLDPLDVHVSRGSVKRALLFLDALIKSIERIGGSVEVKEHKWRGRLVTVTFGGEDVATLRLRERYRLKSKPKDRKNDRWSWHEHDHVPTGLLVLDSGPSYGDDYYCQDTDKGGRIEQWINPLLVQWVQDAGRSRIAKRKAEEERRRREEEERVRREREAELQRRRDELQRKQQAEQAKVDRLFSEAHAWHQGRLVRRYIRAVEQRAVLRGERTDTETDLGRWLAWARQQADRLDPLTPSPPSVMDERV